MEDSQGNGGEGTDSNGVRQNNILNNVDRDLENVNRRRNDGTRNNLNPRDRLFYALFMKVGQFYCRLVPRKLRVLLEIVVLLKGLLLFSFLTYLHFSFGKVPMDCLNTTVGSWPRDGILRVQIQSEYNIEKQLPRFYSAKNNMVIFHPCHDEKNIASKICESMSIDLKSYFNYHKKRYDLFGQCYRLNLTDFLHSHSLHDWKNYDSFEYISSDKTGNTFSGFKHGEIVQEYRLLAFYEKYLVPAEPDRHYIFEYAQEFGFLRISQEARKRLKIPVKVISFDPNKEQCFGNSLNRFILKYFLGYDDVLMNSIKKIADSENNTGYMLNVVTGDHYKFISWGMGRSSYVISLLLMFLFTISISTLLKYCHQQVFFFIIHVLQMMDMNVVLTFPIAPLFTVILSLVGMETIMSEYFNDSTTSFYIILIVWAVDQFDTICCHTEISQKYWLRFFYLYHFIFYSYHYRFNGQYSSIALAATWFLIQHSMLYFLHNYELPAIENGNGNEERDEDAYLDEAVQMIVEGIEMVAGQQNHGNQPDNAFPAGNENGGEENLQNNNEYNRDGEEMVGGPQEALEYMMYRIFLFATDTSFMQVIRELVRLVRGRIVQERRNSSDQQQNVPLLTNGINEMVEPSSVAQNVESNMIVDSNEGNEISSIRGVNEECLNVMQMEDTPEQLHEPLENVMASLQCECDTKVQDVEQTIPSFNVGLIDSLESPPTNDGVVNFDKFLEETEQLTAHKNNDDIKDDYNNDDSQFTGVDTPIEMSEPNLGGNKSSDIFE